MVLCGGIGAGAQAALAQAGIQLFGGISGSADAAAADHLACLLYTSDSGELEYIQNGNRRLIADAAIWDWYHRAKKTAKPPARQGG